MRISDWSSDVCSSDLGDATGDLIGMAQPADRHPGDDLRKHVLRDGGDHFRIDIAGSQRIDGDAELRAFLRQRLGEAVNAGFRSEEHTSELQSLMSITYAVLGLKKNIIILLTV